MSQVIAVLLALGCGVAAASPAGVSPPVQQSSKKFFGKDYPVDKHPVADKYYYFDHPYPAVQDTSDYDRDFVKDENSDGGKWQAQMDYDNLRVKVRKEEKELERLKKKLALEASEMEVAEKAWKEALSKVPQDGEAIAASKKADAAVIGIEDKISEWKIKVEKETRDFKDCEKALADAKKKLQALKDEQAKRDKALKEAAEKEAKEALRKIKEAEKQPKKEKEQKKQEKKAAPAEEKPKTQADKDKETDDRVREEAETADEKAQRKHKEAVAKVVADAKEKNAEIAKQNAVIAAKNAEIAKNNAEVKKSVADMKKDMAADDAAWKKKIADERSDYQEASTDYDKLTQELAKAKADLEKAAVTLKKFRREPHVDKNGGVYNVKKSGAVAWKVSALVVAALAAMVVC